MEYIHYGSKKFDPKRFEKIKNTNWKTSGGLWLSPVEGFKTWGDFIDEFPTGEFGEHWKNYGSFKIKLKPEAKILQINNLTDYNEAFKKYKGYHVEHFSHSLEILNFEELAKFFDGIKVSYNYSLFSVDGPLFGWDVDSLKIFKTNNSSLKLVIFSKLYSSLGSSSHIHFG